jgi:3-phenylpropionate/trans-cinnamate dioxygenase ferredoxin component
MTEDPSKNETDYDYLQVCLIDEIPLGERLFIEIGNDAVVIFNIGGKYYAIDDVCSHDRGPLGEGYLDGTQIVCPRHGARFDVTTGKVMAPPAREDIKSYPVRVVGDYLELGVLKT